MQPLIISSSLYRSIIITQQIFINTYFGIDFLILIDGFYCSCHSHCHIHIIFCIALNATSRRTTNEYNTHSLLLWYTVLIQLELVDVFLLLSYHSHCHIFLLALNAISRHTQQIVQNHYNICEKDFKNDTHSELVRYCADLASCQLVDNISCSPFCCHVMTRPSA